MSTLRETQFIDELRQHYRRLDDFLVRIAHKCSLLEQEEGTLYMFELRKRLFGGSRDPNLPPVNEAELERAARLLLSWPPSPEEIEERKLGAPTGASSVKLEVVR